MIVLKIGLWIIALTLVSAVGAVALVAAVVDANDYKADLAAWVQEKTGRELRLAGDIEVAFFSVVRVCASAPLSYPTTRNSAPRRWWRRRLRRLKSNCCRC